MDQDGAGADERHASRLTEFKRNSTSVKSSPTPFVADQLPLQTFDDGWQLSFTTSEGFLIGGRSSKALSR
jgi:hypothetical protein